MSFLSLGLVCHCSYVPDCQTHDTVEVSTGGGRERHRYHGDIFIHRQINNLNIICEVKTIRGGNKTKEGRNSNLDDRR